MRLRCDYSPSRLPRVGRPERLSSRSANLGALEARIPPSTEGRIRAVSLSIVSVRPALTQNWRRTEFNNHGLEVGIHCHDAVQMIADAPRDSLLVASLATQALVLSSLSGTGQYTSPCAPESPSLRALLSTQVDYTEFTLQLGGSTLSEGRVCRDKVSAFRWAHRDEALPARSSRPSRWEGEAYIFDLCR
jgi:hypothetical protein